MKNENDTAGLRCPPEKGETIKIPANKDIVTKTGSVAAHIP